ncbi:hypothetical protein EJB05_49563, partial [Eragrostis curvula]
MAYYYGYGMGGQSSSSSWATAAVPPGTGTVVPQPPAPMMGRPFGKEEDKVLKSELLAFPEQETWDHYQALLVDVDLIERGVVEVPNAWDNEGRAGRSHRENGCRRGVPWTKAEHRYPHSCRQNQNTTLVVSGGAEGVRAWRLAEHPAVVGEKTRTPTQVASHAQKYLIRQANTASCRDTKRKSIHDITI